MERLNIFVAVLNGNTIAEAYCLDLVIAEPLCGFSIDQESLVNFCVGQFREGLKLIRRVDDNDIALFNLVATLSRSAFVMCV
jgi:hypothetical protein